MPRHCFGGIAGVFRPSSPPVMSEGRVKPPPLAFVGRMHLTGNVCIAGNLRLLVLSRAGLGMHSCYSTSMALRVPLGEWDST